VRKGGEVRGRNAKKRGITVEEERKGVRGKGKRRGGGKQRKEELQYCKRVKGV